MIDGQLQALTTHELIQYLNSLEGLHPIVKQFELHNEARLNTLQANLLEETNGDITEPRLVDLTKFAIQSLKRLS